MAEKIEYDLANHYTFEGKGISGGADTTSVSGRPLVTLTVDGHELHPPKIDRGPLGLTVQSAVDHAAYGYNRSIILVLPEVHTANGDERFDGLAILVKQLTSLSGPSGVKGPLEIYEVRAVSGHASVVESVV
jgi:hypothetical protein